MIIYCAINVFERRKAIWLKIKFDRLKCRCRNNYLMMTVLVSFLTFAINLSSVLGNNTLNILITFSSILKIFFITVTPRKYIHLSFIRSHIVFTSLFLIFDFRHDCKFTILTECHRVNFRMDVRISFMTNSQECFLEVFILAKTLQIFYENHMYIPRFVESHSIHKYSTLTLWLMLSYIP